MSLETNFSQKESPSWNEWIPISSPEQDFSTHAHQDPSLAKEGDLCLGQEDFYRYLKTGQWDQALDIWQENQNINFNSHWGFLQIKALLLLKKAHKKYQKLTQPLQWHHIQHYWLECWEQAQIALEDVFPASHGYQNSWDTYFLSKRPPSDSVSLKNQALPAESVLKLRQAIEYYIFGQILQYEKKLNASSNQWLNSLSVSQQIQWAFYNKKVGSYHKAIHLLEKILSKNPYDSWVIFQVADCYGLLFEEEKALYYLKESLFWQPHLLVSVCFDSTIVTQLINQFTNNGVNDTIKNESFWQWLPIRAYIDIFSHVKRIYRKQDIIVIQQEIYRLKRIWQEGQSQRLFWQAQLLNRCLWLIEALKEQNQANTWKQIDYIYMDIKQLDYEFYKKLTSS